VPREVIAKEVVKMISAQPVFSLLLLDTSGALELLIPELLEMKRCPQPKKFHSEGDVWKHTLLALENLVSKKFQKEFYGGKNVPYKNISPSVVWGLVFHDVGKPYTIERKDRLRFNGHDAKSAEIFSQVSRRLKLSSAGIDTDVITKIIAKHQLLSLPDVSVIKPTTLEKYFFSETFPGQELLELMYADIMATIPPSGNPDFSNYNVLKKRISVLKKKIGNTKKSTGRGLLNGNEIMKILNVAPGKKIGEIKEALREEELSGNIQTKSQAKAFITKKYEKNA